MLPKIKYSLSLFIAALVAVIVYSCQSPTSEHKVRQTKDTLLYLNHHDSAKYVGINTCKLCHQTIYNSFIKTGMGKSFDIASKEKSAGDYHHAIIQDRIGDFYYRAFWKKDSLHILEYRLQGRDTVYKRDEKVDFIIGSGQHTNSHIQSVNGYLNQMPMTFYTQKQTWDLPPGFEDGHNSRFMRKIGLECMSCHNAFPDFVLGSENKYTSIPSGINCERCHGPGSIHVAQRTAGSKIDTSKYIDYSIVNPAKLSIDAQFDICQRCHLQGNTILKEGKSFYDFKPGMKLSDYMTVFLPKYKGADDEFIMASHADRLKQSACFIKSIEKTKNIKSLKPYKEALTCVTCHNPHISVKETNHNVFNDACLKCHGQNNSNQKICSEEKVKPPKTYLKENCVNCHMPQSGSIDIPHVSVHDHFIRKPITKQEKKALKEFIGLYAINEKAPNKLIKARAYLNQYEKFETKLFYIDSAENLLQYKSEMELKENFEALVQLYFVKQQFSKINQLVNQLSDEYLLKQKLIKSTYSNNQGWTCYRIAESLYYLGNVSKSIIYLKQAVFLAPYMLDFKNKLASILASVNQLGEAEKQLTEILSEYPKHVSALTNLGYIKLQRGKISESELLYLLAYTYDSDYEPLLFNLAGLYAYKKEYKKSEMYLRRILKRNPNNDAAKKALKQLGLQS